MKPIYSDKEVQFRRMRKHPGTWPDEWVWRTEVKEAS